MPDPQNLREFLQWEAVYPPSIVDRGILLSGTKAMLYGKYKSMKSLLVERLCLCMADGTPWAGISTNPEGSSVLYLQLEYPHAVLQDRIKIMTKGRWKTRKDIIFWSIRYLKLDKSEGQKQLEHYLDKYKPQVLVIDPIFKVVSGNLSDNFSMSPITDYLDKLIDDYGISIILVNHTVKPHKDDKPSWGSDDMIGGGIWSWWSDSIIRVERGETTLRLKFDVVRHSKEDIRPVELIIDDDYLFDPRILTI